MSAHRHWLWLLARNGLYEGIWSAFIVGELVRVRTELSLKRGLERGINRQRINDLINTLSDVLAIVNYRSVTTTSALRDPDDEPILATAVASGAGCIVSLNTSDFPEGDHADGVRYVTPQQFLDALSEAHSDSDPAEQARAAGRQIP